MGRIHKAVEGADLDAVKALLKAKSSRLNEPDECGRSPLHIAAHHGHLGIAECLFKRGCDIDSRDSCGYSPLMEAAEKGHSRIVGLLLSRGADYDRHNPAEMTALDFARLGGHEEIIEMLEARDADARFWPTGENSDTST